jgi:hypothetical protein
LKGGGSDFNKATLTSHSLSSRVHYFLSPFNVPLGSSSLTSKVSLVMRAVLQRVTGATVHVNGKLVSRIGPGIVALIGIGVGE